MKKLFLTVFLLGTIALFAAVKTISTAELRTQITNNPNLVILDSRDNQYYTGEMLPGAKWVPYDASDDRIMAAIPSKDAPIVVYCFSATCPASGKLIDRLKGLGYTNISEYKEGLKEWKAAGLSTTG